MAKKKPEYYPQGGVHLKHAAISPHITRTVSGAPPLMIRTSKPRTIKEITIYGNTVDGKGVGERTANLFNKDRKFYDDVINPTGDSVIIETPLYLKPYTTYTISTNVPQSHYTESRLVCSVFARTDNLSPSTANDGICLNTPRSITTSNDGKCYVMIRTRPTSGTELLLTPNDLRSGKYYIMLNEGSAALPYESFGFKIPVTYQSYGSLTSFNLFTKVPLNAEETVLLIPDQRIAKQGITDISDIQLWDNIFTYINDHGTLYTHTTITPLNIKIALTR